MPRLDRTGPQGYGPGTGRGFGPFFEFGPGHTFHHNRGLGRYFRWDWPGTKEEQKSTLVNYKKALQEELDDVTKELDNLN